MKGPGEIHLDGSRAVRVAAGVGLAVLGISLVPGLLKPPEPEPLPADVGFKPSENLSPSTFPTSPPGAPEAEADLQRDRGKSGLRGDRRHLPGAGSRRPATGERRANRSPNRPGRRGRETMESGESRAPGQEPIAAAPAPATSPPPPTPSPSTARTPSPSTPPVGDGSIEFAPR